MAFPTIPTVASGDLLSSTTSPPSTTHTLPNLSSLRGGSGPLSGDLLIAICVQYGAATASNEFDSWGASFSEILDDSQNATGTGALGVARKTASGSESGTFTVTSAQAFKSANFLMRIPAAEWHGTTIPEAQAATRASGAVADPGAFNPANWDAEDTLWISVAGHTETSTTGSPPVMSTPPANFSGELVVARVADAVGDITAGIAFRQLNASSEDVGTWTVSNATRGNGIASVIAIRPVPSTAHTRQVDDTLALTDARAHERGAGLADALARSDDWALGFGLGLGDPLGLVDLPETAVAYSRAQDDLLALYDLASPVNVPGSVPDTVTVVVNLTL